MATNITAIGFIGKDIGNRTRVFYNGLIYTLGRTFSHWDVLLLGALFALAFCPYSGVLYFGMLIPLTISSSGLHLPVVYAIATGIPVI